jgi:biopolymer transport protein ExbD
MKIKARGADFVEIDYTPMIDMTFQLIAFFMILINFADGEQDQRVQLPSSAIAKPPQVAMETPITIQMVRDGKIIMSGELLPDANALKPFLRNEKYVMQTKNQSEKDATVIIRADRDTKAGLVQQIIKVCQEIGYEKFTLRARSEMGFRFELLLRLSHAAAPEKTRAAG